MIVFEDHSWSDADWERLHALLGEQFRAVVKGSASSPMFICGPDGRVPDEVVAEFAHCYIFVIVYPGGADSVRDLVGLLRYANEVTFSGPRSPLTDWEYLAQAEQLTRLVVGFEVPEVRGRIPLPTLEDLEVVGANLLEAIDAPALESLEVEIERRAPRPSSKPTTISVLTVHSRRTSEPWAAGDLAGLTNVTMVKIAAGGADIDLTALKEATPLTWVDVGSVGTLTGVGGIARLPNLHSLELTRVRDLPDARALLQARPEVYVEVNQPGPWIDEVRADARGRERWFLPREGSSTRPAALEEGAVFGQFEAEPVEGATWNFSADQDPDHDLEARVAAALQAAIPELLESEKVYLDPEGDFVHVVAIGKRNATRVAKVLSDIRPAE
jgi:hypothetical protein